jgi:hypothetical protein
LFSSLTSSRVDAFRTSSPLTPITPPACYCALELLARAFGIAFEHAFTVKLLARA